MRNLDKAIKEVETTYDEVEKLAKQSINELTSPIDGLIKELSEDVNNLSNDRLRQIMFSLQLFAYQISEPKEKSSIMTDLAEVIKDEKYAVEYNSAEGTVSSRENTATINCSNEIVVEYIYSLITSLLKTKLDQLHRLIDVIKTILMTRMQEAKLVQTGGVE